MDRSLLISWYDVDTNHRDEYLQWLHGSFLQKLMKRDSVLWAAATACMSPVRWRLNASNGAA